MAVIGSMWARLGASVSACRRAHPSRERRARGRAPAAALVLLLLAPAAALAGSPTILVFGDSLSAAYGMDRDDGWPALLEERLADQGYPHEVVNASRSGETTSGGERRLPDTLERHDPAVTVLQLGGNDGLRGQPPQRVEDNLAAMIEAAQGAGSEVVLVGIRIPPNYGQAYTERFEAVYPRLADAHGTRLVPFLLDGIWDRDGMMQDDGIHPTAQAQPELLDHVWAELEPLLDR